MKDLSQENTNNNKFAAKAVFRPLKRKRFFVRGFTSAFTPEHFRPA